MRVFGIDPGSARTGFGCIDSDGTRHRVMAFGVVSAPVRASFPDKLLAIHRGLSDLLVRYRPQCVAVESVFHAANARSALRLGHARGVAILAAVQAGIEVVEYTPAEIKRAVVGYGRAEKTQIQHMVRLLLGLEEVPRPHDSADALAVAICHLHGSTSPVPRPRPASGGARSWRAYDPVRRPVRGEA